MGWAPWHPITHKWQKDRHEAAKMAHIATMQYFINIAEEQCGADCASRSGDLFATYG